MPLPGPGWKTAAPPSLDRGANVRYNFASDLFPLWAFEVGKKARLAVEGRDLES
jgi:hypothetical protein